MKLFPLYLAMIFTLIIVLVITCSQHVEKIINDSRPEIPVLRDTVRIHDTLKVNDTGWQETVRYYKRQSAMLWDAVYELQSPHPNARKLERLNDEIITDREKHNALVVRQTQEDISQILKQVK